jgi:phosphoribosylformimino-5-aminoimidazole carboxamide ribotide isomerase
VSAALGLWPAIDLKEGRVVRLLRGEWDETTVYETVPADVARRFEAEGADGLHVVDLDAAFSFGDNRAVIDEILHAVSMPVQAGGGLRTRDAVHGLLDRGARRAVLGSLPFSDPETFARLLEEDPSRLVVALDCKNGRPTIRGWTEDAGAGGAAAAAGRLEVLGVKALLVTDVARDGAMTGPNIELLRQVRDVFEGEILASGGMRGPGDLEPVDAALSSGPRGAIFGRALHCGATTVARLVAARSRLERVSAEGVKA